MMLLVSNVPIHVYFICLVVFLSHFWCVCGLVFPTMAFPVSSTGLLSIRRLLMQHLNAQLRCSGRHGVVIPVGITILPIRAPSMM